MPATLTEVATAITDLLADGCVWDEDELIEGLQSRGVDLGVTPEDTMDAVLESDSLPLVFAIGDDGYVLLSALLRGRMFTHCLTALEVEHDVLVIGVDLSPLWFLTESDRYRRLVDGTELVLSAHGFEDGLLVERGVPESVDNFVWRLPSGTMRDKGLAIGDLVGLRVRDGGFELTSVSDTAGAAELGARLQDGLGRRGEDEPDEIADLIWQACVDDSDLFIEPQPPLMEAFNATGLVAEGDFVGPPGFDFGRWRLGKQIARLKTWHRLDEDEALAVLALTRRYEDISDLLRELHAATEAGESLDDIFAHEEVATESDDPDSTRAGDADNGVAGRDGQLDRELLMFLGSPRVAETLLMETIGAGREGAAALGLFAESLEEQAPRSVRAPLRWLRAKALERLGRVLEAEEALEAALSLDGDHFSTLLDLARYASDRGNAERGLSLLRRADVYPDDELVVLLSSFRSADRTDIGRNEPCWCGSGRKFKVCHRNRDSIPLADRAAWLYQKAATHLTDGPWREQLIDVAEIWAAHREDEGAVWDALNDGLVGDLMLFEGGAFQEFVAERGVLLPADEQMLADQWLLAERSVHEIESVSPGVGLTVRDVRTGDRAEVRERTASKTLLAGDLICARVVPAGDTIQIFGGVVPVALPERDRLIALLDSEPDPEQLATFFSARFAPPKLQNTEGEPMVLCEATLRTEDPDSLAQVLDVTYDRLEEEEGVWIEHVTTHGMDRIRTTLRLDGGELHLEANSEARMERILAKVHELQPELTLITETRRPASDLMEAMSRAPLSGSGSAADLDDPAVKAALEEFIRAQEVTWLDEPIPALGGVTPREAAADPTRRPDLLRLLDGYDAATSSGAVSMDPARLRKALGLLD